MTTLAVELPPELVETIAARAAELVLEQLRGEPAPTESPYMTIVEATAYIGATSRQRIDNLLSQGRLPRHKDGARTLIRRDELNAYLDDGGAAVARRLVESRPGRPSARVRA